MAISSRERCRLSGRDLHCVEREEREERMLEEMREIIGVTRSFPAAINRK